MKVNKSQFLIPLFMISGSSLYAQDPVEVTANVALTSDYVVRGITQTDESPALQGGFNLNHISGGYLEVWMSNVKFLEGDDVAPEDRAHLETDYYAGYANSLPSGFNYDLKLALYTYPGAGEDLNYDYWEGVLNLGYAVTPEGHVGFEYAYAPEFFGETGTAHYYKLNAGYSMPTGLGFNAWVGRQDLDEEQGGEDYTDYGVGIDYTVQGITFTLNYTDTDLDNAEGTADGRVFLSVERSF